MAYELPTPEEFKTRYPSFSGVADETIEAAIDEATRFVDETWIEGDYKTAIMLYVAHVLSLEGLGGSGGISASTAVRRLKSGTWEMERFGSNTSSGSTSSFASTTYGQRFMELRAKNHPAVAVVG